MNDNRFFLRKPFCNMRCRCNKPIKKKTPYFFYNRKKPGYQVAQPRLEPVFMKRLSWTVFVKIIDNFFSSKLQKNPKRDKLWIMKVINRALFLHSYFIKLQRTSYHSIESALGLTERPYFYAINNFIRSVLRHKSYIIPCS